MVISQNEVDALLKRDSFFTSNDSEYDEVEHYFKNRNSDIKSEQRFNDACNAERLRKLFEFFQDCVLSETYIDESHFEEAHRRFEALINQNNKKNRTDQ